MSTTPNQLHTDITTLVQHYVQAIHPDLTINEDTALITSGLLTSLQIIDLASQLEAKYHLDFATHGFDQYDFDTIQAMIALVNAN